MRRTARIAVAVMLLLSMAVAGQAGARPAGEPLAQAALKKCKKGLNAHKCACPRGQKLSRKGKKFRCVKKPAAKKPAGTTPVNPNPDPGTAMPPAAPPQPAADSQQTFTTFMKGSSLSDEGYDSTQTFRHKYVYTFCQDGTYKYYSENLGSTPAGSSSTSSQGVGTWSVAQAAVNVEKTLAQGEIKIVFTQFQTDGAAAQPAAGDMDYVVTLFSRPTFVQSWVNNAEVQRAPAGC